MRIRIDRVGCRMAVTITVAMAAASASAQTRIEVIRPLRADVSRPLAELALMTPADGVGAGEPPIEVAPTDVERPPFVSTAGDDGAPDPAVQRRHEATAMPAPLLGIDGLANPNNVLPPDTNLDVGPAHVVQWVNLSFAVFAKDGSPRLGPTPGGAFWIGFGGDCELRNDGDPIVLYDHLADRWIVAQFTLTRHQCVAVSTGPDPLGTWYRYDYRPAPGLFPDYPKLAVWPSGYGYSARLYQSGFVGAYVGAFERAAMLAGDPGARLVGFRLALQPLWAPLPADLDGPPPADPDAALTFVSMVDDAWGFTPPYDRDALLVWELAPDWTDPGSTTFTEAALVDLGAGGLGFDSSLCNLSRSCVPQPGTPVGLDPIPDRLMYRPQLRVRADHRSLAVSHTVDATGGDRAGVRWYELRDDGGGWAVHQGATYSPDTNQRFMGDVAMDSAGNLVVGFSVSAANTYPGVRMAGRLAADPPGVLALGEIELVAGAGSQTHTSSRWGDYSSLAVDPVDDCTFWYTQEYLLTTGLAPWRTWIAALRLPGCGDDPRGTLYGSVIAAATGDPIAGATVSAGSSAVTTDASGAYSFDLPAGVWDVAGSARFYAPTTRVGVEVGAGLSTRVDLSLESGWMTTAPPRVDVRLSAGGTADEALQLVDLGPLEAAVALHALPRPVGRGVPAVGGGPPDGADAPSPWDTGLEDAYGIAIDAVRDTAWVGTAWSGARSMTEFHLDGSPTGRVQPFLPDPLSGAAGLAFDPLAATVWVLHAGLGTCLHELDPARGATGSSLCPAWPAPARGLTFDPAGDSFLVSVLSGGLVRVDRSGSLVGSSTLPSAASGLALNPANGHLFALDADGDPVRVLVEQGGSWTEVSTLAAGLGRGGGLALGCDGTLWAVDASDATVHPIATAETVECAPGTVDWLEVSPAQATVPAGDPEGIEINLGFTADGAPGYGLHLAAVRVDHTTPPSLDDTPVSMTRAFADVPAGHWADSWIHSLAGLGVTTGCGGGLFCPDDELSRAQMAVMVVRIRRGTDFMPPAAIGLFGDVAADHWAAPYIEQLWADGITAGCGVEGEVPLYCPDAEVSRAQMAVFVCRARGWTPLTPTGRFADVPADHWAAGFIERLAEEGVTAGCSADSFCPDSPISRAEIAVFLVRAWDVERVP